MAENKAKQKNADSKQNKQQNNAAGTYAFSAEIAKVLKLMIHSLYTNKDIFLRELISNASDACDKLRYQALTDNNLLADGEKELKITISADDKNNTITVRDNGIGMNRDDLIANLGTIAKSGTGEFLEKISKTAENSEAATSLIGQFGVGFYSCFMVADKVIVKSRKAGEQEIWQWESTGEGEFAVTKLDNEANFTRGTEITLYLRKDAKKYADKHKLSFIAQTYSDHISFPIEFVDNSGNKEQLNKAAALWTRPKSEITKEQYKEFYNHVAHQPDDPWLTLHNKLEGKISYTNLLFIPSVRPFDLFSQERRRRVKLYVKRVFITDENVELVPAYLRFLRGVVDSEDLPLNISRETLQDNPLLEKIKDSITKKVLNELQKKAKKEPEEYAKFWRNFGAVLKEGLCEMIAQKEKILETSWFYTTYSETENNDNCNQSSKSTPKREKNSNKDKNGSKYFTTMDDYISRMKPNQDTIYYLLGDRIDILRNHPQLEGFKKHGVEVLLLVDQVDDFWVNVVNEYKGKQLKSITKASDDLSRIIDSKTKNDESKDSAESDQATDKNIQKLIESLQKIYGDQVKQVRVTNKLAESPVCLAVGEGDMDIRMERFLRENKQLPDTVYAKILEINPSNQVIKSLAELVADDGITQHVEDIAWLLLDQARIIEGEEPTDANAFSRRLTAVLSQNIAA